MSAPTKGLIDCIEADKVRAARRMTPAQRFAAGLRLFDYACRIALDGIRSQQPGIDERQAKEVLRRRLRLVRRLEHSR